MSFILQDFVDNPDLEKINTCRKDDLLCIASHYNIPVAKYGLKKEIKSTLIEKLVELNVLSLPDESSADDLSEEEAEAGPSTSSAGELASRLEAPLVGKKEEPQQSPSPGNGTKGAAPPATLQLFEGLSPESHESAPDPNLHIHITRMQIEAQEKDKIRQADYELRLQVRKLEIEADKEIKLKQLELEAKRISSVPPSPTLTGYASSVSSRSAFDVGKNIALVPTFRETEVDTYFSVFERIATALQWPKEMWAVLLQCKLMGKAQEVASSLSLEDSLQYDTLKESVLRAYELVPEAYRQRFRNHKRSNGKTFVEFAREKGVLFDKWCTSNNVNSDYESLRQLILLEDFKGTLPEKMVVYLNEQKTSSLSTAAVLADEFVLTHKNVFVPSRPDRVRVLHPGGPSVADPPSDKAKRPLSPLRDQRECFYCHKRGHILVDCLLLKRKQASGQTPLQPKGVGLIRTVSSPSVDILRSLHSSSCDNPDPCFKPFITEGFVSHTEDPAGWRPVKILRDTGGSQSLIHQDVLPLLSAKGSESSVVVQGVGMRFVTAPLCKIFVQSSLVNGLCKVAILPALPIKGIDFILGNDLAGGLVNPVPELHHRPDVSQLDDLAHQFPGVFPACAVTRSQSKNSDIDLSDSFLVLKQSADSEHGETKGRPSPCDLVSRSVSDFPLPATREEFVAAQKADPTLSKCFSSSLDLEKAERMKVAYIFENGLLLRRWANELDEDWNATYQVVVPSSYRSQVLSLAHDDPWAGHMGVTKTYHKVLKHFFWPGLKKDVVTYCRTCHICQIAGKPNQVIPPAPLKPIPVMGEPFERVLVDCVGPLPKTKSGHQYLLTIMCTSTRFPEAIPLRTITASAVTKALVKFFTTFGLPKVIQTDQGTNFMSKVFNHALKTLKIKHVTSAPYHPESQGALERFHQTMKSMLRKHCNTSERMWDESVPFVLFAVREAVQESLGFSPAELVFGHEVRGPLKMFKETLVTPEKKPLRLPEYVSRLRSRLQEACSLARETLTSTQAKMKQNFDKKAVVASFQIGDSVLVLLPIPGSALFTKFSGPYRILEKLSDTNYVIQTPERRRGTRVCHVNMMKPYHSREAQVRSATPQEENPKPPQVVLVSKVSSSFDDGLVLSNATQTGAKLANSEMLSNLSYHLAHLPPDHRHDIESLIEEFPCLFNDIPSQTSLVHHDIVLTCQKPLKQNAYRVNPAKREIMKKETDYLVQNGFAVPSSSPWSSPCLLDAKSDGSPRFCTDFRKVNAVTVPDAHPLPLIDDCIDEVGPATYVSKLDMLKGYWQVPLTPRASEISAFVTPDCFLQYTVMPFGLCNAPATFQRLVNLVLGNLPNCKSYLDDIVVYTRDWMSHMSTLREVFRRLSDASLTLNLAKCEFGKGTVLYLGQQVGSGKVCPADAKVKALAEFPVPSTRRELRRFLGMSGFYRRYCRNFSTVAAPLTALTSPSCQFIWTSECQNAFENLKGLLCCSPVLSAPDFCKPFKLEVDASAVGAGAVLLQEDKHGVDHPVSYFSRKFNEHQQKYSTVEKETLALLLALQHFEAYLGSSSESIRVYTDHNPLVFLSRMYNNNQRLMRWALIVQEYNLEIVHKKGSENIMADALSRAL